jgi:glycosyltransferase 2 family protein
MNLDKKESQVEVVLLRSRQENEAASKNFFNSNLIKKGTLWFIILTIASVAIVFFYSNTNASINALRNIDSKYIFICFGMLFMDLMLGSFRNHIFIRKLKPGISHWVSFKANVANMFMGAITPFHSGAGPAQLYVYNRYGIKVLDGFIVSLINMGATLLFMPIAGLFAIWAMNHQLEKGLVPFLLKYGFSVFLLFLLVFLLAFLKPLWIGSIVKQLAKFTSKIFPKRKIKLLKWGGASYENVLHYQKICKKLLQQHPFLFPFSFLLTTILYLNKYCMQYFILLGLGIHNISILEVLSIQILIEFMIYFAPSPGGSGLAEASIAVLFSKIVPNSILPIFTLLQRAFLLLIPALIGALVLLNLLKKHTQTIKHPN